MPARAIACLLRLPRHIWPGGVRPSLWLRQPPCASSPWRDQAGLNLLSRYGDFGRLSGVFSPGHDLSEVGNGHSGSICKEGVCYRCPETQTTRKCRPRCGAPGNHSRYSLGRGQRLSGTPQNLRHMPRLWWHNRSGPSFFIKKPKPSLFTLLPPTLLLRL